MSKTDNTEYCALSERVDGKLHSWNFDGDDPYVICYYCKEVRDALNGKVIKPGISPKETDIHSEEWEKELNSLLVKNTDREDPEAKPMKLKLQRDLEKFINSQIQLAVKKEREKYDEIFRWLLGYEDFAARKEGEGAYWWRKELRKRLDSLQLNTKKGNNG